MGNPVFSRTRTVPPHAVPSHAEFDALSVRSSLNHKTARRAGSARRAVLRFRADRQDHLSGGAGFYGTSDSIARAVSEEFCFQIEVWKSQESFTYFKIFKPIRLGQKALTAAAD